MSNERGAPTQGLHLRGRVIPTVRLVLGLILASIIVIGSIILNNEQVVNGLIAGLIALAGSIVGILLQPKENPQNYSTVASASVERMYDMGTDLDRVQATLTSLASAAESQVAAHRMITAQDILFRQQELLQRTVSDWDQVDPGVAATVRLRLDEGTRRFAELIKGEGNG